MKVDYVNVFQLSLCSRHVYLTVDAGQCKISPPLTTNVDEWQQ